MINRKMSMSKLRPIDVIGILILIVHASALYGFVGIIAHIRDVRTISIASIGLMGLYLLLRYRVLLRSIFRIPVLMFAIFILGAPIFISFIQAALGYLGFDRLIYWSGFFTFTGFLFLTSLVLGRLAGPKQVNKIALVIILMIIAQFVVNIFDYTLVREVAVFIKSNKAGSLYQERLAGFFPHPNQAAISIVAVCFILVLHQPTRAFNKLVIYFLSIVLIMATGSRTSLILMILLGAAMAAKFAKKDKSALLQSVFLIFLGVPVILFILQFITLSSDQNLMSKTVNRMQALFVSITGGGEGDVSTDLRIQALADYSNVFLDNLWIGIGFDGVERLLSQNVLKTASQNSWLQWAVEFGIFYTVLGVVSIAILYIWSRRATPKFATAFALQIFILIVLIATFSIDDIFSTRALLAVLGLLIGQHLQEREQASTIAQTNPSALPARESTLQSNEILSPGTFGPLQIALEPK